MIDKIRLFLKRQNLDALLITRTDSFMGEHYPPEKNQLFHATGFSGSAGMALISSDKAVLFVDSRYTEQAKIESGFQVFEIPTQTTPSDWMMQNLSEKTIGYSGSKRSAAWVSHMTVRLKPAHITLKLIDEKTWDTLLPPEKIIHPEPDFDYDLRYCGESTISKIQRIIPFLKEAHVDAFLFGAPDSVSWILNRRNTSVPDYPVVFDRLIVFTDGSYEILTDKKLSLLKGKTIGLDFNTISETLCRRLQDQQTKMRSFSDIVAPLKAVKNPIEQQNIREACFSESIVLCRFLAWIERGKEDIDELMCDKKLRELRSENPLYRGDSFDTIAAVGEHAARAHYHADKKSNVRITSAPMLMVDTGGNYLNGTTDMTRTICTGTPTDLMKRRYTQVLKGHIALATTRLKSGDLPCALDKNAHTFLRADGVDYRHATGHGIGMFLDVHEAPPVIYEQAKTPLVSGMVFSNEPACYDSDKGFGIRLENMILTQTDEKDNLILENLIFVPFDGRLIDFSLLTQTEKEWLADYHQTVREKILPHLTVSEQQAIHPLLDFFPKIG